MLVGGSICDGNECTELVLVIVGILAALAIGAALCFLCAWYGAAGALRRAGVSAPRAAGFVIAAALALGLAIAIGTFGADRVWWLSLAGPAWGLYERTARS